MVEPSVVNADRPSPWRDRAIGHAPSHLRFWIAAAIVLALDLWSKAWVFESLRPDEVRTIIPRVLEFRRSLNDGAVFGSLTGHVELFIAASVIALGFVLYLFYGSTSRQSVLHVALGFILAGTMGNLYDRTFQVADVVTHRTASGREQSVIGRVVSAPDDDVVRVGEWPDGTHVQTFPKSAVQIRRQGVVRDFIKFVPKFPDWVPRLGRRDVWPWIFNLADGALVCGVAVLLLGSWADRRSTHRASAPLLENPR